MPCTMHWTEDDWKRYYNEPTRSQACAEAVLCGILSMTEKVGNIKELFDTLDYQQIGLSREEVENWWKEHKKKDLVNGN